MLGFGRCGQDRKERDSDRVLLTLSESDRSTAAANSPATRATGRGISAQRRFSWSRTSVNRTCLSGKEGHRLGQRPCGRRAW